MKKAYKAAFAAAALCGCVMSAEGLREVRSTTQGLTVATQRGGPSRNGEYIDSYLVPANVSPTTFGKVWEYPVDGDVYAQPLIVEGIQTSGFGAKNVVLIATNNNTVYEFDADSAQLFWSRHYNAPMDNTALLYNVPSGIMPSNCNAPNICFGAHKFGILGTPVASGHFAYFVVADADTCPPSYSSSPSCVKHWVHRIDLNDGSEAVASVQVQASDNGQSFNSYFQLQRPGLLLQNGHVYIGFGGDNDQVPYHGWLFSYDATTLVKDWAYCTTCGVAGLQGGSIWQAGSGLAGDGTNVFFSTGNVKTNDVGGNRIVKAAPDGGTTWYETPNSAHLSVMDADLGSAGPILLPGVSGTQYVAAAGKEGKLYLLNAANIAVAPDAGVQAIQISCNTFIDAGGNGCDNVPLPDTYVLNDDDLLPHVHGSPVYWTEQKKLFVWSEKDYLRRYSYNPGPTGTIGFSVDARSQITVPPGAKTMPGGMLSLSTDGVNGIIWAAVRIEETDPNYQEEVGRGIVRAIRADTLTEIWHSPRFMFPKFPTVTPSRGRVYVPTFESRVLVFGQKASTIASVPGIALTGVSGWTTIPVAASNGDGSFTVDNATILGSGIPGSDFANYAAAAGAIKLHGDFNNDGRADIALLGGSGWLSIPVAESTGTVGQGVFEATNNARSDFAGFVSATTVDNRLIGDFTGDHKSDIALMGGSGWTTIPVAISSGDVSGHFSGFGYQNAAASSAFNARAATANVTKLIGDFDRDGRDDVALVGGASSNFMIAYANYVGGSLSFSVYSVALTNFPSFAAEPGVVPLVGDFDGDGYRNDIVLTGGDNSNYANYWTTIPVAFPSTGRGNFVETNSPVGSSFGALSAKARYHLVGDFDGDGVSDVALVDGPMPDRSAAGDPTPADWSTLPVAYSRSTAGSRTGSFVTTVKMVTPGWNNGPPPPPPVVPLVHLWNSSQAGAGVAIVSGDFDSDGRSDIALTGGVGLGAAIVVAFSNGYGQAFTATHRLAPNFAGWASQATTPANGPGVVIAGAY